MQSLNHNLNLLDNPKYRINEIFGDTIQGEGKLFGLSAIFIRLAHCNLSCSWCDTEFNTYKKLSLPEIMAKVYEHCKVGDRLIHPGTIVITGGEPLINPVFPLLLSELLKNFKKTIISIESNGTMPMPPEYNTQITFERIHFTVSPKKDTENKRAFKDPYFVNRNNLKIASEIKIVVDSHIRNMNKQSLKNMLYYFTTCTKIRCTYCLSPEWSEFNKNLDKTMEIIKEFPQWKLSIQAHKFLNLK